jgi:ABC-type phosphonate transport system ATPase subunit
MIEIDGLTKKYGDKTAVDGLSFVVEPGVVTGFLGPNGAPSLPGRHERRSTRVHACCVSLQLELHADRRITRWRPLVQWPRSASGSTWPEGTSA